MSQKTAVLASLYNYDWFYYLLRAEGYSVMQFDSGAETLSNLLTKEPDLLILFGFALQDMTNIALIKNINETIPNRKAHLMYLHQGDFDNEDDVKWNVSGVDVAMPCYFPNEILPPILRKIEAMNTPGST